MATVTHSTKKATISADLFLPKLTLTLTFSNGKEIVVDANQLSEANRNMAMLHGLKQKLVDAAAISRNLETGASATVDEKYESVKKIADRLTLPEGKWNEGRAAGEASSTAGVNNILLRALMKMTGRDEQYCRDFLGAKSKEERAALRKNPRVVQIMAELQAATVVNGINTDNLLDELGLAGGEDPVDLTAGDGSHIEDDITPKAAKPKARTTKRAAATA